MRLFVTCSRAGELAAMDVDASGKGHGYIGTHYLRRLAPSPAAGRPAIIGDGEGAVADCAFAAAGPRSLSLLWK